MTDREAKDNIQSGILQLSKMETLGYYNPVIFNLVVAIIMITISLSRNEDLMDSYFLIGFFVVSAIVLFFHSKKKLKFQKFRLAHSEENFIDAANSTARLLDLNTVTLTESIFVAEKHGLMWLRDGMTITILKSGNRIYSNCINTPSFRSHQLTFGWRNKCITTFNNNLFLATKGNDVPTMANDRILEQVTAEIHESEWTFINTMKRVLAYLFSFCLLAISILTIKERITLIGVGLLIFSAIYPIIDIMAALEKRKQRKKLDS